jgi:hypothetical protein
MASWVKSMSGPAAGLPGGLPTMGDGCCCGDTRRDRLTYPPPDRNGALRANFACMDDGGQQAESACSCEDDPVGVDDVFLALDWRPTPVP